MATIITRETTAPGVTNNQAPLTNSQLDQNFINLNTDKLEKDNAPYLDFNTTAGETILEGKLAWDDGDGTLAIGLKGGISLKVGQEQVQRILNNTGSTLTKGQAVYITGAQGQRLTVALAQADAESTSSKSFAIVTENIANGSEGFISSEGLVRNINTSGIGEGSALYLSPTTPGALTTVKPTAPNHIVLVGFCVRQHATVGSIFVKVQNGFELDELHNVSLTSLVNGQVLAYESSTGLWKNTASPVINYLPISGGTLTGDLKLSTIRDTNNIWLIGKSGTEVSIGSSAATNEIRFNSNTAAAFEYRSQPILHSGNYNTYSPTLSGTGATGTWPISISGNAATVTNGITTTNYSSYALPLTGGILTGLLVGRSTTGAIGVDTQGTPAFEAQAASGAANAAYMTFHRPGSYAVRFGLDTDNVLKVGGWSIGNTAYPILHSNNYSTYALPLSGGDMTGRIRMGSFPNSTVNSGEAWIGRAADRSTGTMTVQLGNDAARVFEVVDKDWTTVIFNAGMNNFTYKGNTIYHSGNIPTWNQNTTGNAATATKVNSQGDYSNTAPGNTRGPGGMNMYQVYANGYPTTYGNVVHLGGAGAGQLLIGWSGTDGAHAPNYIRSKRDNDSGAWSPWALLLTDQNYSSYALPLTGGTLTGSRTIKFDTTNGNIEIRGDTGGWATGMYFIGSSGTNRGGFGGYGGGDSLTNFWVGTAYNNAWMTFTSSAVNAQVALQQSGNQVLHAANYSSYALPLTGGGITGNVGILRKKLTFSSSVSDFNHSIYNNYDNIDSEGSWDGMKINAYLGLKIRTGNASGATPTNTFDLTASELVLNSAYLTLNTGGSNTYGLIRGYNNWNHMIVMRGIVTGSTTSPTISAGHNQTFIEYVNSDSSGWFFKSSDTGTYVEKASIRQTYSTFSGSVRAPIFYDSDDTAYWVNPAGDGTRAAYLNGNILISPKSEGYREGVAFLLPSQATWGGLRWLRSTSDYTGAWAFGYFGNEANNDIGFHNGTNGWRLDHSFNNTVTGSVRSPIFYDSNDTGYYCDPNSTSILNYTLTRRLKFLGESGDSGMGTESYAIYQAGGSWAWPYPDLRIAFHTGIQLGANSGYQGIRFYNDYDMATQVMSVNNGSDPLGANNVYVNNSLQAGSSLRAPIFYDSNDTGYYVDPASTSNLNALTLGGRSTTYAMHYAGFTLDANTMPTNSTGFTYSVNAPCTGPIADFSTGGGYDMQLNANYGNSERLAVRTRQGDGGYWNGWRWVMLENTWINDKYFSSDGIIYSNSSFRAPIFYDYNDTGYYCDPASTNRLNFVNSNNHYIQPGYMLYSDHGSWQGEYNKIQWHSSHLYLQNNGGGYLLILRRGDGGERFYCDYSGNVTASGNITAYSDIRLKKNVQTIEKPLELVSRLRGVTFDWIETNQHSYGLIAQEVEQVIPELVMETQSGTTETDNKTTVKSVDYSKLVSVLIEAVKELNEKVALLESKLGV